MNNYPIYIVSKNRADKCITSRALNEIGQKHTVIVEEEQLDDYKNHNAHVNFLTLPKKYLDEYDTCDDLGNSKSKGPGAARNFALEHSLSQGFRRHWVMDDNLDAFHRVNRNEKFEVRTPAIFLAAEDFVDRYTNVPVAGFNYYSFVKKTDKVPPFIKNTRIYSCLLIDNEAGYRWRGRYNEDTDLSLRVLKDGKCTIQFNAFLCGKITTQRMKGGNTDDFYIDEGTLPKSEMLVKLHPDVAKVVWRFNRWHHHVDYKPFKNNELIRKSSFVPLNKINNYGMVLREI